MSLGTWVTDPSEFDVDPTQRVALDVETTGLGDGLRVRSVQLAVPGRGLYLDVERRGPDQAATVLAGLPRLYAYGLFDARALAEDGRFGTVDVVDMTPLIHLASPKVGARGQALKSLMKTLPALAEHVTDVTAEQTLGMATTDPDFIRYAMTDALAVAVLLDNLPDADDWLRRENRIGRVAEDMGARGVRIDRGRALRLMLRYRKESAEAEAAALSVEPEVTKIRSVPQNRAAAERRGVELPMVRRKGKREKTSSYSRKHLMTDDEYFTEVHRTSSKKFAADAVKALLGFPDNVVHTRWKPLGAVTSRWSSSGPNMQNISKHGEHREIRGLFVPRDGLVFVQADLSQIEYRVAGALAGDEAMLGAFHRGEDLHLLAAAVLAGRTDPTDADRSLAKGIGFGKLYGQGLEGTALAAGLSEEEMARRIETYDRTFPQLAAWAAHVTALGKRERKTPVTPYGRRFPLDSGHKAVNYTVQSTARELFCDWLLAIDEEFPGAVVLAVHDEVVLEVLPDDAEAVAARITELAETLPRPAPLDRVPIVAKASVAGDNWENAYRKGKG